MDTPAGKQTMQRYCWGGCSPQASLCTCSRADLTLIYKCATAICLQDLQDSSEEEEGEGNEYDVTDKFLVADDDAEDDEEGGEGDAAAKRRKKRRRR